ncbi:MAG: hypothetical protein IPQ07_20040 [Myxococcales bacterium]|nr:hypothetical protein [Myxococcales bacterium]
MLRVLVLCGLLVGCSKHEAEGGRVQVDKEGGLVVVRDTTRAIEVALTRSSAGLSLEPYDLPEAQFPGRIALDDPPHGRAFMFWITRLGAKRPANIQRWFDEKVVALRKSTILSDRGEKFGEHFARVVDYVHHAPRRDTYQRFIGVDVPEHDLEVIVIAISYAPTVEGEEHAIATSTPEQQRWLDDVAADVRAIRVSPAAVGSAH